jgi:predicted DNA-binding protein YlxM (UPF0122 family)
MQLSVNDAAEHFGVSKEAIHNRIRRGSLEVVVENGVKLVVVDEKVDANPQKTTTPRAVKNKNISHDERYYRLLEDQNAKLQLKVERLEGETRSLRDQKEQMLIAEREKIENIYKEKDEHLKNILSTLSQQFMLSLPQTQEREETLDAEIEEAPQEKMQEIEPSEANIVSLKEFIKSLGVSEKKSKKLKERFKKRAQIDRRIITLGEKIYLDTLRYDYSDLL